MTKVGEIIQPGQSTPDDVIGVTDRDGDELVLNSIGHWHSPGFTNPATCGRRPDLGCGVDVTEWGPLTVTAVRKPEPQQADVSALIKMVLEYGDQRAMLAERRTSMAAAAAARWDSTNAALFDRIAALVPQQSVHCFHGALIVELLDITGVDKAVHLAAAVQNLVTAFKTTTSPDPLVLSLPQVPDGAVGAVGKSGRSYPRQVDELSSRVWWQCGPNAVWSTGQLLDEDGPVTVVMREPRTWPKLDGAPGDVHAVRGVSGKVYVRRPTGNFAAILGPDLLSLEHELAHWQVYDGPLTEVFEDEPQQEAK